MLYPHVTFKNLKPSKTTMENINLLLQKVLILYKFRLMKLWKVEKFSAKKCQKHFYSSLSDARKKTISLSSIFAWIQRQFSNSEQKMKLLLFLIEILCNGNRHNTNNLNDSFKDSFQMFYDVIKIKLRNE